MNPGGLSHLVRIESRTETTRSAIGEEVVTWATFASMWASIEPIRGEEGLTLRAQGSEITTRIRMRYIPDVKPAMRVVHGDDVYSILEVYSPREKRRELEMLCSRDAD